MSCAVSVSDVERNFGRYHDCALSEPVRVTKDGRETVYIVSAKAYHEMKRALREALATTDLSDVELAFIGAAEIPAEHRYAIDD